MKKHKWILYFLLLAFFACNEEHSVFEVTAEGLEIKFTPVAGGSVMHYTLPKSNDIFGMNVRYINSQGRKVLKTCGYTSDSVLLDGFTQAQEVVNARISFVNQRNEESTVLDYQFKTLDSAPWFFFDGIEVSSSWNGFQVVYKTPEVVTGIAHVFYLGINPETKEEDMIPVRSFPINRGGDTLNFVLESNNLKNTVVIRTEDFKGYRVREEIYPDIDAFRTEKLEMTAVDFNDNGLSVDSEKAKTGKEYLFDGELMGLIRMIDFINTPVIEQLRDGVDECGTYVAGPNAFEKPIVLDLKGPKVPAWIRLYRQFPMSARFTSGIAELGKVWRGAYEDKLPCSLTVYGNPNSNDPNDSGWVKLTGLNQEPKGSTAQERWTYTTDVARANMSEFEKKEPIYVDIQFKPVNDAYRYLKIVVHNTFLRLNETINMNQDNHFTLHELEVYVKKN